MVFNSKASEGMILNIDKVKTLKKGRVFYSFMSQISTKLFFKDRSFMYPVDKKSLKGSSFTRLQISFIVETPRKKVTDEKRGLLNV